MTRPVRTRKERAIGSLMFYGGVIFGHLFYPTSGPVVPVAAVCGAGWFFYHLFRDAQETTSAVEPDRKVGCSLCGARPTVPATGLCGPHTFGEADTANGNW